MKWAAVMLAIVVSGALGAYAIYTFRPQDEDTTAADATRATMYGRFVADQAQCKSACEPTDVRLIAGSVWHIRVAGACYRIDVERFNGTTSPYKGISRDDC